MKRIKVVAMLAIVLVDGCISAYAQEKGNFSSK